MDPLILYKGDDKKTIASVDAPAWLADGWATDKPDYQLIADEAIDAIATTDALPVPDPAVTEGAEAETSTEAEAKPSVKRK